MLTIKAKPTFTSTVDIVGAGGQKLPIEFVFNHMERTPFEEFVSGDPQKERSDEDTILAIARGWNNVEAEFNRESLHELFENFHSAAGDIARKWFEQLTKGMRTANLPAEVRNV